jgi:hypothetical protein
VARFKAALQQLWDRLLSEAQDVEATEDDVTASVDGPPPGRMTSFLASILPFIASFSGSNVRALRAGSTACGLALGGGLVTCAVRAAAARDTAQRQVQSAGGTGARSAAAKAALAAAQAAVSACEAALKDVYTQVFTLRFRDTEAGIRSDCISSMGSWITGYPAFFLKDYYLKYLGWALNDKAADVRLAAVTSITSAYTTSDRAAAMSTFIGRFAPRLVDMARGDVDDAVAAACVRLLGALHEHGTLPADGSAAVLGALLDDAPLMRSAAAEVVPSLLGDTSPSQGSASAGAGHHIHGVLRILGAGPDRPHAADAAVEALWDKLAALKDWDALLAAAAGSSQTDERATTDGVRLLAAVCRKLAAAPEAFTGGVGGHAKGGVRGTKAAKDAAAKERGQLSTQLMGALPRLLASHGAHVQRAGELADCVIAMSLEMYALKRNEPGFETLLTSLTGALFKQTAGTPLAALARALAFCAHKGPAALQATAEKHADGAIDKLATRLKKLLPKPRGAGPTGSSGDSGVEIALALSRLRALQEAGFDIRHTGLGTQLSALLDSPAWCASLGDSVTSLAASNAAHMVLFGLAAFGDGGPRGDDVADAVAGDIATATTVLKVQRDALVDQAVVLFRSGGSAKLKRTTFALLCDLAWVFSAKRLGTAGGGAAAGPASTATALTSLGWTPPADLLEELWACALAALPESGATAASQALFSQEVGAAGHGGGDDEEDDTTTEGGLSASPSGGVSIVPSDKLRSTHMLACIARLVLYGLLPGALGEWLSGRLMSLWAGHGPVAAELAKRASVHAKRFTTLAAYERAALGAVTASFERHCEDEYSAESAASLRDTASKVSGSFGTGGHAMPVSARTSLGRVVEAGVTWALVGAEPTSRLPFLTAALPPFVAKLTADAKAQVGELLTSAAGGQEDADDVDWAPFFALRQMLTSASGGAAAAQPAKKRGRAAGKKKGGGRRAGGRGSDSEEEDPPSDAVEDDSDPDDAAPPRAAAKAPTRLPRGGKGATAAAPPVAGPDGWIPFRKGAAATSPGGARAARAPSPEEEAMEEDGIEEAGEDEDAALEEEEEPEAAPVGRRAQTFGRKRREPLFLGDDDEDGGAGGGGSESEELPEGVVPPAKKGRR